MVVVPPGQSREYDAAEWRDAIVVVEPLRRLRNPGREPTVLVGVARGFRG